MKNGIAIATTLFATLLVSVGSALAIPLSTTVSGAPAPWRSTQVRRKLVQPSEMNLAKPVDVRDKQETKAIEDQTSTPTANQCIGDARSATPPVVNNPHHLRNVIWRNMRMNCAR